MRKALSGPKGRPFELDFGLHGEGDHDHAYEVYSTLETADLFRFSAPGQGPEGEGAPGHGTAIAPGLGGAGSKADDHDHDREDAVAPTDPDGDGIVEIEHVSLAKPEGKGGPKRNDGATDGGTTDGGTTDDGAAKGGGKGRKNKDAGTTDGGTDSGGTDTGGADGGGTDGGTDTGGTPVDDGFDITLTFTGFDGSYAGLAGAFESAAAKLESWILGDLPDVTYGGETIDDVRIDASLVAIDGNYGILGQAGPTAVRYDTWLPTTGIMQFDTADALRLSSEGKWEAVILHEMLHVLGMGTLWGDYHLGLVDGAGTSDPRFNGVNANTAYIEGVENGTIAANDANYRLGVPIETGGGGGTAGAHWRESALDREVMTGFLDARPTLEAITIAALEDMGYDTVWDDVTRSDDLVGVMPADDVLFA